MPDYLVSRFADFLDGKQDFHNQFFDASDDGGPHNDAYPPRGNVTQTTTSGPSTAGFTSPSFQRYSSFILSPFLLYLRIL